MLLGIKKRQEYLKELGFYGGAIDGKEGSLTKRAYKELQNKYFTRSADKDGKYGQNTEKLLKSAYNFRGIKYFKLEEVKCKCNSKCSGYPEVINRDLVIYLDDLREHFGKSTNISSGLRCSTHNKAVGGTSSSRHPRGKAVDIYITGINNTLAGRKSIIDYWIKNYTNSRYAYCNGYFRNKKGSGVVSSSTMGSVVHVDIK